MVDESSSDGSLRSYAIARGSGSYDNYGWLLNMTIIKSEDFINHYEIVQSDGVDRVLCDSSELMELKNTIEDVLERESQASMKHE